jgi:hypothetical protein
MEVYNNRKKYKSLVFNRRVTPHSGGTIGEFQRVSKDSVLLQKNIGTSTKAYNFGLLTFHYYYHHHHHHDSPS